MVAAGLRLFPIWFGLPHPYTRPDEEVAIGRAVAMLEGDLHPHFFHWPSLIFYVLAALYTVASWARRVLQLDPELTQIDQILLARGLIAFAGTATVVVVYRLARRMGGETTGLLAAAFLAVAVLHVRDSHFAMTDILMTLLVTIALALLGRAIECARARLGPSLRIFAAAGFVGGLAASTKYSGAAVVAAMAITQVLVWRERNAAATARWAPSAAFMVALAAGFITASPYAVLDFRAFSADLLFDFRHLSEGHEGVDLGRGWVYHVTHSLPYGLGIPVFVAALAGILPMARHHRRHVLMLGGFAVAFYCVFGSGRTVFFRYILPLVPVLCVFAAVAVRHAAAWLALRTGVPLRMTIALLVAITALPGLVNSLWLDVLLSRTDTRVLAARWLDSRVQAGESVHDAGGQYTRLRRSATDADSEERPADWLVLHDSPLRAYAATPPDLHELAAQQYNLAHTVHARNSRRGGAVYDLQDAFFLPMSGFKTVERPGPTIRIYRRR